MESDVFASAIVNKTWAAAVAERLRALFLNHSIISPL